MLDKFLSMEEGKTLEFKENTSSMQKIVQTVIAFANTAGGVLVIGVRDKTKEVVGLANVLQDEEKVANAVSDCVAPLLIPSIYLYTWRGRDVLIIEVQHAFGPYYLKPVGIENGTFVRLGSTNRIADAHTISQIQQLKNHRYFDEQANYECSVDRVQFDIAKKLFQENSKKFTEKSAQSLSLITEYHGKKFPTNGAVLLFGKDHTEFFPNATVRLGRFLGFDKSDILDSHDLEMPIALAIEPILQFIKRHTSTAAKIIELKRQNIPQYPRVAVREAVINALLHTDYSIRGAHITIAIFDDRIEITSPGGLPFGLSLESALSGISLLRNKVIGHVFRELDFIEQWGSGLGRIVSSCEKEGIKRPKFEEIGHFFRVTLYHDRLASATDRLQHKSWHAPIVSYLQKHGKISAKQAQKLWAVTPRTTTTRLKSMCNSAILSELSTSPYDPHKVFSLKKL